MSNNLKFHPQHTKLKIDFIKTIYVQCDRITALTETEITFQPSQVTNAEHTRFLEPAIQSETEIGFKNASRIHEPPFYP